MSTLKTTLQTDMKNAMKAKESKRLSTIRLILAAIKQIEVDERIELDDARILQILDKMRKQRIDSLTQFKAAGRDDLATIEQFELDLIQTYLPKALSDDEVDACIKDAIAKTGASGMADMGKLMAELKPQLQGKADMGQVSAKVKAQLN